MRVVRLSKGGHPKLFWWSTGRFRSTYCSSLVYSLMMEVSVSEIPRKIHVDCLHSISSCGPYIWCDATRGLFAMDHVILNNGQVTWSTPELAPPSPNYHSRTTKDVSALDIFNVHRYPTRWVFSGTGLELMTKPATIQYLDHSATAATQ
ncbi:uncharacterized protein TNCV_4188911 [Trichonephila clavipes]|nr:uncharacterized protein TNCV_4188911 [Trichonephila clavipes]